MQELSATKARDRRPYILACNHAFCRACITANAGHNDRCPLCRRTLFKPDPPRLRFRQRYMDALTSDLESLRELRGLFGLFEWQIARSEIIEAEMTMEYACSNLKFRSICFRQNDFHAPVENYTRYRGLTGLETSRMMGHRIKLRVEPIEGWPASGPDLRRQRRGRTLDHGDAADAIKVTFLGMVHEDLQQPLPSIPGHPLGWAAYRYMLYKIKTSPDNYTLTPPALRALLGSGFRRSHFYWEAQKLQKARQMPPGLEKFYIDLRDKMIAWFANEVGASRPPSSLTYRGRH